MLARALAITALSLALAGCFGLGNNLPVTVEGECRVFTNPGFAVQGKRPADQRWISKTQETGIKSCGWARPSE